MARTEQDREDLLREATALRERIELSSPSWPHPVVCGFKSDGSFSVYLGQDPVYHFSDQGALRRSFKDGYLFRSQGMTLSRLERQRTNTETTLLRYDLNEQEHRQFLDDTQTDLLRLLQEISEGRTTIRGQVLVENDLLSRVRSLLESILNQPLRLSPALK